jgi:hypothetical protein
MRRRAASSAGAVALGEHAPVVHAVGADVVLISWPLLPHLGQLVLALQAGGRAPRSTATQHMSLTT